MPGIYGVPSVEGEITSRIKIWNPDTLAWEAATGSIAGGQSVEVTNFPTGYATAANQVTEISYLTSIYNQDVPVHDYIALTYVTAGNGLGEIETVTFKTGGSGGSTVATFTLAYDANDNLASVTKT